MEFLLENLSWLCFLVIYAVGLIAYFVHKNGFSINANCWFCNENTKVLFSKRNNFDCGHCGQYNGFNKDGGYNKIIQAQHKTSMNMNIPDVIPRHSTQKASNGLCDSCNRNQELKVRQLAKYEPLNERKYEEEIKHFDAQLEKTYKLCKPCSKVVASTVKKQTAWIFGNKIKNSKLHRTLLAPASKTLYNRLNISKVALLALAILTLFVFDGLDIKALIPKPLLPSDVILNKCYGRFYNTSIQLFGLDKVKTYLPRYVWFEESSVFYVGIVGFIAELLYTISFKSRDISNLKRLALWIILSIVTSIRFQSEKAPYVNAGEHMCIFYLMYVYGSTCLEPTTVKGPKRLIKKEVEDSDSDVDLDSSYKTAMNNSFTSVKSRRTKLNQTFNDFNPFSRINSSDLRPASPLNSSFNNSFAGNDLSSTLRARSPLNSTGVQKDFHRPLSPTFDRPLVQNDFRPLSPTFRVTSPLKSTLNKTSVQKDFHRPLSPTFDRPQSSYANNFSSQTKIPFGQFMNQTNPGYTDYGSKRGLSPSRFSAGPTSPNLNIERPTRTFLSPSRLNIFNSDGKNTSFHMNFPVNQQRFVVNSVANIQCSNPFMNGYRYKNLSRSSRSSSGCFSHEDFVRDMTWSLPNSRENSPDRDSVLSEPIFLD